MECVPKQNDILTQQNNSPTSDGTLYTYSEVRNAAPTTPAAPMITPEAIRDIADMNVDVRFEAGAGS